MDSFNKSMRLEHKYSTKAGDKFIKEGVDGNKIETDKIVISEDAFAVCDMIQSLRDSIEALRLRI